MRNTNETMDSKRTNRRTVLKTVGAGVFGTFALTGTVSGGKPPVTPPEWSPTWGTDETDKWELTDTSGNVEREKTKPYYLLIPTGLGESPHFFGFDQVVDTPPQNKGAFNVNWHTHNVFYDNPGHEHDGKHYNGKEVLTGNGQVTVIPNDAGTRTGRDDYLNTVDQIKDADEKGYANEVGQKSDIPSAGSDVFVGFTFVCPVRPRHGKRGGR